MSPAWFEVWADDSAEPPYVLLVLRSDDRVIIRDPRENNRIVFSAATYDEARLWLNEDEYTLVTGRMVDE